MPRFSVRPYVHRLRVALAMALLLACRDSSVAPKPSGPTDPGPFTPSPVAVARIDCTVSITQSSVSCPTASGASADRAYALGSQFGGSPANLIFGSQGTLATLTASGASYSGQVFSFDATITNLVAQAIGTTDGVTPDANGVRVFFPVAPQTIAGSGTVDFINPAGGGSMVDGVATFTAANQSFYQYSGILAPGQTSAAKRWRFHVPTSVTSFTFSVDVNGAIAHPNGWVDVAPSNVKLRIGQTATLTGVARDIVGNTIAGATIAWSSGTTTVATVNAASGVVTATGDGVATITASTTALAAAGTPTITGTSTITVNTASAATTTMTASPTALAPGGASSIVVRTKNAAGVDITTGGNTVALATDGGTLSAVTDRGDGTYTATLSSTSPRVAHVSGTLNGAAIAQSATVTFTGAVASFIAKIGGDAQSARAGTAVATPPAVQVTDADGRPMAGVAVAFAISSGGGSGGGSATTDANGVASTTWTLGTVAGPNTMTAAAGSLSTTFSATGTSATVGGLTKIAGDVQVATVGRAVAVAPQVRVVDAAGVAVAGAVVNFVAGNGGTVAGGTQVTDADGKAAVGSWTLGRAAGPSTLTVTSGVLSTTFVATATAGAPAQIFRVAGDGQSSTQGTAVATPPTIRITDDAGNPVANVSVTFAAVLGAGHVAGGTQLTDAAGLAKVDSWTLGAPGGTNTLSVTAGALNTLFTATATPASAGGMAKNTGDGQTAVAGAAVFTKPAVRITDNLGNPVAGATVTFAVASGGGSATGASQTTNASGIATVGGWTLGSTAGENTLSATSGALAVTFSATGIAGSPVSIAKSAGDAQSGSAGTVLAVGPAVLILDVNGNPVSGVSVTFAVASGGGSVAGSTQTTNANGIAAAGSWTLGASAGVNTLTATAGSLSATFTATGVVQTAAHIDKTAGDAQTAAAGASVAVAPAVRVTDASGNPVAGVVVSFAPSSGGTVAGGSVVTNASGAAVVGSWTLSSTAGPNTLTASVGALSVSFSATGTGGGGGGGGTSTSTLLKTSGDAQSAQAGTAVPVAPVVQVIVSGAPKTGVPVTFTVATGGGSITGGTAVSDATGFATLGSWTLGTVAGPNTLTVTGNGLTTTFTATGTPGPLHHFLVEAAAGGVIASQNSGTPFAVKITAKDVNNNTVTSFVGTADLTSNLAASAGLGTTPAFVAGVLASQNVTLTQTGAAATITATRTGGSETGTSVTFAVNAGALHHFLVEQAGGGAIGTQTAGAAFNVRITAQDAANNTVAGFTGTAVVSSNRIGTAGLTTTAAFTAGVLVTHAVTLTQAGATSTLTATVSGGGAQTGTSNMFAVNADVLHHFAVEAAGGGAIATQTAGAAFNIQVTAQDQFNNTVASYTGAGSTVDITSTAAGSSGLTTTAAFTNGVLASHAVTLTQSGTATTIMATRTSGGAQTGTSAAFIVNAGVLHHFKVEAAGGGAIAAQAAGAAFNVQVTAQDVNNNTVTGFTGAGNTVDIASTGTLSAGSGTTTPFTNGVLAGQPVTISNTGSFTITATKTGGTETGASNAFTVAAGALHHFLVEAAGGGAIATQTAGASFNIRITAQDAANNTVTSFTGAGNTVNVTSNRTGSAGLTTSATFTNGVLASHAVTLTQSGAASTITATRTSGGAQAGTSAAFTMNDAGLNHFAVEAAGGGAISSQTAGTAFSIQVTAQDQFNNTVTSFTSTGNTVDISSGGTLTAGSGTTPVFTSGVLASRSVTIGNTGSFTITATRTSGGAQTGTSAAFTVGAGVLAKFAVEKGGGGAIAAQTAASAFNIRITAQDANGNTVTSFGGASTVDLTSNAGGTSPLGLGTVGGFTAGVLDNHSVTLNLANAAATITATKTAGTETGTSGAFAVNAGALAKFAVEKGGGGAIGTQASGVAFNIRVTAQDAAGNTVTSFGGASTVDLTSNAAGTSPAGLGTVGGFTSGVLDNHSVTLNGANVAATVTATRTASTETGASAAFILNAGALHHFKVEAAGGGAIGTQAAGTAFNVQITAQDVNNNTVATFAGAGSTVNIASTGALSSGGGTTATFTNGVLASQSVTISNTGSFTITATKSGGTETGVSTAFTVTPGAVHHFLVEAAGGGAIGTQTAGVSFNIQITAQDILNNTVTGFTGPGNTVNVTSNRTGSAGLTTSATFTNGVLTSHAVTLTQSGGGSTITATRTSGGAQTGTSAAFTANAGALQHFLVEAAGGGAIPAQTAGTPFNIQVTAQDQFNNTVASFTGAGNTVDITSNVTGSSGLTTTAPFTNGVLATHAVTLTQSAAAATITATRTSGGAQAGTSAAFTVNAAALNHFKVEAAGGGAIATQSAGTPFNVQVTAQDQFNNTVTSFTGAGNTVNITSTGALSSGGGTTAPFTNGVLASQSATISNTGSFTITATRTTGGTESGASTAFTVNAGTLHHFLVEAAGGGAIAAQTAGGSFNIQITAQDIANNTVTSFSGLGNTVNITSNRTGSAGLTTTAAFTNGVLASHAVTLTQSGAASTLTATRTSGGAQAGTSPSFAVNDAGLNHFAVEAAGGGSIPTQTAGTAFNIQVTAQDQFNNTVSSFTAAGNTVDITSTGTLSAGGGTTGAFTNGVLATRSVTITNNGSFTITATRTTGGAQTGSSTAFAVNPAALHHFLVEAAAGGPLGAQTAGTPFNVRITAQDINNNTVTSFTGVGNTVNVSSNRTGSAGLTTSATFTNGVLASHAVTLTQSGTSSTITATRTTGGSEAGTSATFTVNAAALAKFAVEAVGGGPIATQTVGQSFNIQITAQDAFGNTQPGFTGTVNITSSGTLSAGSGTTAAFTSGVLATLPVTVSSTGSTTITATKTASTETGTSAAFTVNAGALDHFAVEASGGGSIATQTSGSSFNIRVTAQDVGNNTVTAYTSTVTLASNAAGTSPAGLGTSPAFTAGVLTQAVTLNSANGAATITATNGTQNGTSNTFTVNPGALSTFKVEANGGGPIGTQAVGAAFSIQITAQDAQGNTVTSFNAAGNTVTLSSTSAGASSSGLGVTGTFTNGVLTGRSITLSGVPTASATIVATRTSGGAQAGTSNTFTLNVGALHHFAVDASGGGAIQTQLQDNAFNIQVTAQDLGSNTLTAFGGTVEISSSTGTLSAGSGTTAAFASGVLASHSVKFSTNGSNYTITATKSPAGPETGTSATFTMLPPLSVTSTVPTNGAGTIASNSTIAITFNRAVNATASSFTLECPVSANKTFTVSGSGSATITLTPSVNMPANTTCTVTVLAAQINDVVNAAFHPPANATFSFTTAFVVTADTYTDHVIGNVGINSANATGGAFSVVANDQEDGISPLTWGSTSGSSNGLSAHGTVTMITSGASRGQFTYEPNVGFSGTDTFFYTITPATGSPQSAQVTLTVDAPIWFIDNTSSCTGVTCDGRLSHPFTSLSSFNTANLGGAGQPASNQVVFMYQSATNYTGPVTLLTGQKLVGQDASTSLASIYGTVSQSGGALLPAMNSADGVVVQIVGTGGVALPTGASATLRGLTIATTGGAAISAAGATYGTLTFANGGTEAADVTINSSGGTGAIVLTAGALSGVVKSVSHSAGTNGINFSGATTGSLTINGGTLTGSASGAAFNFASGSASITYAGAVSQAAAAGLVAVGGHSAGTIDFTGTLTCNTSCTGVAVSNTTGGTVRFSGGTKTLTAVTLATNTGAAIDFTNGGLSMNNTFAATGGGTIQVTGASNTISTTNRAMNLSGVTIGASGMTFSSVTSSGGANNLTFATVANTSSSTITLSGGALSAATGNSVDISGGTAPISYAGTIDKTNATAGNIVNIASRAADVTLSGNLTCNSSCTGISVASQSGGTVSFSGTTKTISPSSTNKAVSLSSNTGGTIQFTNGGLALTTSSATGFDASGGGTIVVGGNNNTISTTTGVGASIASTTIGGSGVTFKSISASGGANGIFLSGTGAGQFSVTGVNGDVCTRTTATCSGGTLGATAAAADGATGGIGVYMSNVTAASLNLIHINGAHPNFGIYGNTVSGLKLTNVLMDGTYGDGANVSANEGALSLDELAGNDSIANSYFGGGAHDNVRIHNASSLTTLTRLKFLSDTIGFTNTGVTNPGVPLTPGNNNVGFEAIVDAGTTNITVQNSSFLGAYALGALFTLNGGTSDVVFSGNKMVNTQSNTSNVYSHFRLLADGTNTTTGSITYTISGNTMNGSNQAPIQLFKSHGTWTMSGTVSSNTIGNAGTNSGALNGEGILIRHTGPGEHRSQITGNNVQQYNGLAGLFATFVAPISGAAQNGTMQLTVLNNSFTNPGNNVANYADAVHFEPITATNDAYTMCVNLGHGGSNTLTGYRDGGGFTGAPYSIGDLTGSGTALLKVAGLSGGPYTGNAAQTPIQNVWSAENSVGAALPYINLVASGVTVTTQTTAACAFP